MITRPRILRPLVLSALLVATGVLPARAELWGIFCRGTGPAGSFEERIDTRTGRTTVPFYIGSGLDCESRIADRMKRALADHNGLLASSLASDCDCRQIVPTADER